MLALVAIGIQNTAAISTVAVIERFGTKPYIWNQLMTRMKIDSATKIN